MKVMPLGLKNAAQTFQRFMDVVIRGLDFAFCYVDDLLIASANETEHYDHLRQIFEGLKQYGISINLAKCVFGAFTAQYLGYQINQKGAKSAPEKVNAILNYNESKTIAELRLEPDVQAPLNAFLHGAKK